MQNNPYSYLHVVKPYLHFKGEKKDPQKHFPLGLEHLKKFKDAGILIKDKNPGYYIYRIIKGSTAYTGIIAAAAVDDYNNEVILKHENTLTEKQNELAAHIRFFNGLGNPVLLTYPDDHAIDDLISQYVNQHAPEYNFISPDQVKHNLWVLDDAQLVSKIEKSFEAIPKLYIADGHHRTAGFATYCEWMRAENPGYSGNEPFNYFPVCLIPFSRLQIFEYHRLVKSHTDPHALIEALKKYFDVQPSGHLPVQPINKGEFGIYTRNRGYLLHLKPEYKSSLHGTLERLDVSVVEQFILKDILHISDSKTDNRLSFLDGSKGLGTLQQAVDSGEFDIAITLFPTSIEEVQKVADEKLIMPPKSTWIEPKIRTGLIIHETVD